MLRDVIFEQFGENAANAYDGLELYTYVRAFAQDKKNLLILLEDMPKSKNTALGEFMRMIDNVKNAGVKLHTITQKDKDQKDD